MSVSNVVERIGASVVFKLALHFEQGSRTYAVNLIGFTFMFIFISFHFIHVPSTTVDFQGVHAIQFYLLFIIRHMIQAKFSSQ